MVIASHVCSQINLPLCKTLEIEPTVYDAIEVNLFAFKIYSPYTLALLLITVFCAIRMMSQVESIFSSIGRTEMKTVFFLYLFSNLLLVPTLCFEKSFDSSSLKFLNVLQNSFMSTTYFALCASGYTTDKIYGIFGVKASAVMRALSTIYFIVVSTFIYVFVSIANKELIVILITLEIIFMISYLAAQVSNLKKNKSEIWGFGVLGVIFLFFVLAKIHTFLIANFVALFSERNIDNLFMNISYTFLVIMMCYKFWLSTYDFELECLALYE